jgi:hypothetical protein
MDKAYCTIQSANMASLPAGVRVSPASAANMPKLKTMLGDTTPGTGYDRIITTEVAAHHYRLRGIEFTSGTTDPAQIYFRDFIKLGESTATYNTLTSLPNHIVIDRCYIHPQNASEQMKYAVYINAKETEVTNCYIGNFRAKGSSTYECKALEYLNAGGIHRVINNYISASAINMMVGGAPTQIPGVLPSDFTVRRNHFTKLAIWKGDTNQWVKNLFEIKYGRRFTIDGNLFDKCWLEDQGTSISFKITSNSTGANPADYETRDVTFSNNWVRHGPTGLTLAGTYADGGGGIQFFNVKVLNNLWTDLDKNEWGTGTTSSHIGSFIHMTGGSFNTTIDHNTAFHNRQIISLGDGLNTNFTYTNNITDHGVAGASRDGIDSLDGDGIEEGSATFDALTTAGLPLYFTNETVTNNVMVTTSTSVDALWAGHPNNWFPSNFKNTDIAPAENVRMVAYIDSEGEDETPANNYRLGDTSVYKAKGARDATDSTDVGANLDVINTALGGELNTPGTSGVISGNWTGYGKDIFLHPGDGTATRFGTWLPDPDVSAASESSIRDPETGAALVTTPVAAPANYFQMTFQAEAGVEYKLYARMKAEGNLKSNDSAWFQFDKSVNAPGGTAICRIGTTTGMYISPDNGSASLSNWGWSGVDSGTSGIVSGTSVYFSTTGTQTVRVQRREDGVAIDQIVLSPATYMNTGPAYFRPGLDVNDSTIMAKQ